MTGQGFHGVTEHLSTIESRLAMRLYTTVDRFCYLTALDDSDEYRLEADALAGDMQSATDAYYRFMETNCRLGEKHQLDAKRAAATFILAELQKEQAQELVLA